MEKFDFLERPVEYEQAHESIRYFLDHKSKLFGYIVTINGLLLTVILTYLKTAPTKIVTSFFVVALLIFAAIFDRRITKQIKRHILEAKRIERKLGYELIQNVYPGRRPGGAFALIYTVIYCLAIVFWLIHITILWDIIDIKETLEQLKINMMSSSLFSF